MNIVNSLLELWKQQFANAKVYDDYMRWLCRATLPRQVLLSKYKFLDPIEMMPEHEKKEMKKYVISLFPTASTKQKLEYCKIIYTFGTLL